VVGPQSFPQAVQRRPHAFSSTRPVAPAFAAFHVPWRRRERPLPPVSGPRTSAPQPHVSRPFRQAQHASLHRRYEGRRPPTVTQKGEPAPIQVLTAFASPAALASTNHARGTAAEPKDADLQNRREPGAPVRRRRLRGPTDASGGRKSSSGASTRHIAAWKISRIREGRCAYIGNERRPWVPSASTTDTRRWRPLTLEPNSSGQNMPSIGARRASSDHSTPHADRARRPQRPASRGAQSAGGADAETALAAPSARQAP
jgi:hypothetical protein